MKNKNFSLICVLLAATLWGTAGLFVRTVEKFNASQMQIVLFRSFFTVAVLGIIILFKDKSLFKLQFKDTIIFASAGLLSIVMFNYSYYVTMSLATLSVAAVLLYTAPFFVVIISVFLFNEKLSLVKIISCIIAFIGCCFVTGLFASSQKISPRALFFGLLTGLGYALYTIYSRILFARGYKTLTITFYVFLSAFIFAVPFVSIRQTAALVSASPEVLWHLFLMAVFNTVLPYIFYTTGLLGVGATTAPIIATLEPVVATVVGAVFFREAVTLHTAIGILLVLCSVILLNIPFVMLKANAKINIGLGVTGKREDGYHLIDTVMQSVTLYDSITVLKSRNIKLICSDKTIETEKNIAFKAAELFFNKSGINGGAVIYIKKRIPLAAGLGGGSADAAAVLLALNTLYGTDYPSQVLSDMAQSLGADVPFFISGGTQRAEGIGEKLTPLTAFCDGAFVLFKDGVKLSTKEMYSKLDELNDTSANIDAVVNALESKDVNALNSFAKNAFSAFYFDDKLHNINADFVSLSGSGPVKYAYFSDISLAKRAFISLKKENSDCFLVSPCQTAIVFE